MEPWQWALLLKPLGGWLMLTLPAAALSWVLYRVLPDGPVKVAILRVRNFAPGTKGAIQQFLMALAMYGLLIGGAAFITEIYCPHSSFC